MDITIYTTEGCGWCVQMKELCRRANLEYTEVLWSDLDEQQQTDFMSEWQGEFVGKFPAAIIDGVFYSGLIPVAKKFMADGLVTAPKK
tara:strand:+ start:232 stop:495 length:264 start_codon:yes stop_codon:yes gene_type:complete